VKRFYLLVEGQTEETFVRDLLVPHYSRLNLFLTPILLSTSPGHKGGVTSYGKVKRQIVRLCRQDGAAVVSTFLDLYGLPMDFPGRSDASYPKHGSGRQKAQFIESRLAEDVAEQNFIPYLAVHEFEAMLFTQPQRFAAWSNSTEALQALNAIALAYATPEEINDDPKTAPSKRILELLPEYKKTLHGPLIAFDIGLDSLRNACPHFHDWLLRLEKFAS